jgi:hypothetical protein
MSHYTEIKNTRIHDLPILLKTLQQMGCEFKLNQTISGHQGKRKVDVAVKVYGDYLVGFKKNSAGTYDVIADWSCAELSSGQFVGRVKQIYNTEKVLHEAKLRGYSLIQQKVVNGGVRLVLRKIT